ncbi:MAG: right-handed parallel beta-helix repeat-containing protein [Deltaproteobacteria bacterium]|nr:right-handed parallel beta-helix repeat-containing protein [Deltaproteobacteria bacterium]
MSEWNKVLNSCFIGMLIVILVAATTACSPQDEGSAGQNPGIVDPGDTGGEEEPTQDEGTIDLSTIESTEQLQNALDSLTPGSEVVIVSDGTPLNIETTLQLAVEGVTIKSADENPIVLEGSIDPATGLPSNDEVLVITGDNITLEGFNVSNGMKDLISYDSSLLDDPTKRLSGVTLRNMIVHDTEADDCIQLTQCDDCTVENVEVYNCGADGISFTGGLNPTINGALVGCDADNPREGCEFGSNSHEGFVLVKTTNGVITIKDVVINSSQGLGGGDIGGAGIQVRNNNGDVIINNVSITGNILNGSGSNQDGVIKRAAVEIDGQGTYDEILGYTAAGDPVVRQHNSVSISNVTIDGNVGHGLYLEKADGDSANITLDNVVITNNAETEFLDALRQERCTMSNSSGYANGAAPVALDVTAYCIDGGGNSFTATAP